MIVRTRRVADRTHEIEDGADSELAPERRDLLERGMIRRREDVTASGGVEALLQAVSIAIDLHAHRFEHVCGAYSAADRSIAVLGDRHAGGRGNQRRAGRNVESAGAVAAGAASVEHLAAAKIQ